MGPAPPRKPSRGLSGCELLGVRLLPWQTIYVTNACVPRTICERRGRLHTRLARSEPRDERMLFALYGGSRPRYGLATLDPNEPFIGASGASLGFQVSNGGAEGSRAGGGVARVGRPGRAARVDRDLGVPFGASERLERVVDALQADHAGDDRPGV